SDRPVEFPGILRQFLMIELELAGVRIERDPRGRVKVLARSRAFCHPVRSAPIVERGRVGGSPPHRVGLSVKSAGHPTPTAASPPRFVAPTFLRLRRAAHCEELPDLLARLAFH